MRGAYRCVRRYLGVVGEEGVRKVLHWRVILDAVSEGTQSKQNEEINGVQVPCN